MIMPRSTWHGMRIFASSASPVLGEVSCLVRVWVSVGMRAGVADQAEDAVQRAEGRGRPRLAGAGGRPELDRVLAGRAGGRMGRGAWAATGRLGGVL